MAPAILIVGVGFTGKLVLEYLAKHPERSTFELQAGGRSASKLSKTIADAGLSDNGIEVVTFDLQDAEAVERAVLGATVVISCAGPFFRYGTNVVRACARHGRHYVDITGEVWWQKQMIEDFDFLALKTGATIVPGSCFDSIPSDLTAYTSVRTLQSLLGPDAVAGKSTGAFRIKGGFSGGTAATIFSSFEEVPRAELRAGSVPYSLSPVKGLPPAKPKFIYTLPIPSSKPIVGSYFLMASANTQVVRRSWGILQSRAPELSASHVEGKEEKPYGDEFEYDEFMQTPGKVAALIVSLSLFAGAILAFSLPPFRWFLKKYILPGSGEGPSPEVQKNGMFRVTNITSSAPSRAHPIPRHVRTVMEGKGDPGYLGGSVLVSESALALLPQNRGKLTPLGQQGGLLTPATAFGSYLGERLAKTGRFTLSSEEVFEGGDGERKSRKSR